MSYHTLVYNVPAAGAGAANTDATAATDTEISIRNSHYIFTEKYRLLMAAHVATSALRARFQVPRWNAIGEFVIANANRSLQPPANPQWDDWRFQPPEIPQNEEFQVQISNNLGAMTEIDNVVLQIAPDDWNANIERGEAMLMVRATAAITTAANAWTGSQAITLSQSLRGGVYAIVGTIVQGTNAVAYRWIFPRNKLYHGRRMRPGGLTQNAVGDALSNNVPPWLIGCGTQGYFHTFELPSIELFGTAAATVTYQIFFMLVRLGEDPSILNRYTG